MMIFHLLKDYRLPTNEELRELQQYDPERYHRLVAATPNCKEVLTISDTESEGEGEGDPAATRKEVIVISDTEDECLLDSKKKQIATPKQKQVAISKKQVATPNTKLVFTWTSKRPIVLSDTESEGEIDAMVGKKSGKALKREEGLERTDNNMKQTSWNEVTMINQKNYYTEFMKRDDQVLSYRLQNEANREKMIRTAKDKDRALARTGNTDVPTPTNADGEEDGEDEGEGGTDPTKVIVIHPGSQNLRIGFASDALPKTITMCIGAKGIETESEVYESRPKRQKMNCPPEEMFGEEFSKKFTKMSNELKLAMRANKRKILPNSKELVVNFNKRTAPEKIPEHNDPMRIEWTDITEDAKDSPASSFVGLPAQRIADDSKPAYRVRWPMQHGVFNEKDYTTAMHLYDDFETILETALKNELGLGRLVWNQYSCIFVVPDLYDKKYIDQILEICLKDLEFKQVSFIQESLSATYGAGYTSACVVDIGAQKTSIACVEDGMILEESRINLKYGGYDVTETFMKMMLYDHFPYEEINLMRRYDFLLAEELKINYCTMNQAMISVQNYNFHLRAPNQPTHKYQFKTYDETILAPMGFFDPSYFHNSDKLKGRHTIIPRSYNTYDPDTPDDPNSNAQLAILTSIKPSIASTATGFPTNGNGHTDFSTPQKEKPNPFNHLSHMESQGNGDSQVTSAAASPAPEGANTPVPPASFIFGANGANGDSPAPNGNAFQFGNGNSGTPAPPAGMFVDALARTLKDLAVERDSILPVAPLDTAIIASITHAVDKGPGADKRIRDFFGGIMVIGGGAKTPGLGPFLEEKLKLKRPDLADKILVGTQPREMDGQVVVWKGASVFARMETHESWIGPVEYERLGSRVLQHRVLWHYS